MAMEQLLSEEKTERQKDEKRLSTMNKDVVIRVEGLYKKFCRSLKRSMLYGSLDTFRNILGIPYDQGKLRKNEFWALEDVNFELKRGETLGIIGINGSGKSTLLRMITGIFPPDKGRITINGRVSSLIAVGAGFHPQMTGRENIYLNGTILGMTKKEIQEKFDNIVDFADIGEFLDAPVSTYSSGMKVRLGFAIAVHCEPDILLVDEILSVGDLSFRNKSLRYMANLREKAKGIIFISHNLEQVRILCNRVIIMDKGKIVYDGKTHNGIVVYEEMTRNVRVNSLKREKGSNTSFRFRQTSDDEIEFLNIGILDKNERETDQIEMDEPLQIYCDFKINKCLEELYFSLAVVDEKNINCIWIVSNDNYKKRFENLKQDKYRLLVEIKNHHLIPNVYYLNIAIRNNKTGETYERSFTNSSFRVLSDGSYLERGIIAIEEEWKLEKYNHI
jgi:lipopolysaccharide transport system ATP-binding protein